MDTGGFLTGEPECPQYVSIEKLYDFLTDTTYIDEVFDPNNPKHFARIEANVTVENIRAWANDLNLTGTNRKNVLYGNDGKNVIKGEAGNDVIYGREGNDTLYGGNDNDTIIGGAGDDLMDGGKGDDTYIISSDDLMQNDVIIMNSGRDSINFRNDILAEIDRNSFSFTNENGSLIIKYQTVSRISSQRYDNTIKIQDYFNKNLLSNFESIVFTTFIGNDPNNNNYPLYEYNGREGVLDIFYKNPINYTVEQDKSNNFVGSKLNDSVTGGNKNDTITGADGYDTICGGNGSDLIKMGNNNDIVYGSNGDDKIYTENGVNYITYENANGHTYSGFDTIFGSSKGRDYIEMKEKSSSDISYQKAGNDLVIVYNQATGDSVTISSYFKKKGKTSVKSLELSDDTIDLVYDYGTISSQAQSGSKTTGTSAYDTLKGGAGSDSINGLQGHDMIYGGAGNDILVGGAGNDKLYGQAGENTYKFSTNDGNDTINFTKNTTSIIDISATGLEVDLLGISDSLNDGFSYTKSNNDLIINYGTSVDNADKNIITIANYFKQNGDFIIKGANDTEVALKDAFIRFEGEIEASNKLTTSQYNDYITGGILADTINAGKGNDIIYTGLGDDIITGGADSNEIYYYKGDGNDTINLTKGENLTINIVDIEKNELKFEVVKNDLVISYLDDDAKEQKITLKNFGTKDVVNNATKKAPDTSSVKIYLSSSDETIDLKKDIFLPYYVEFTPTKNSYTGTWFSDFIDARDMNIFSIDDNKGANINAGKGNDIIYGCMYNDTIKGGDGNDYINAYGGNNNLDGGNGSDTYRIFYDKDYIVLRENSTIKDTGKGATDKDTVLIESKKDNIDVWFNINKKGKTNYAINVIEYSDATKRSEINYATITNVEDIIVNGMTTETTDDLRYDYDNETLKQQVIAFLNNRGYKDAAQVFNGGALRDQEDLMAIYNNDTYWETV